MSKRTLLAVVSCSAIFGSGLKYYRDSHLNPNSIYSFTSSEPFSTKIHPLSVIDDKLYEGNLNSAGKPHGFGCAFYDKGNFEMANMTEGPSLYCGTWINGFRNGLGSVSSESGELWDTTFKDGKMNGDLFYSTKEGAFIVGKAIDNEIRGQTVFVGEIELCSANFDSHGPEDSNTILMSDNGHVYHGPFVQGKKHGEGREVSVFNPTRVSMVGKWIEDNFYNGVILMKVPNAVEAPKRFDEVHIQMRDGLILPEYQFFKLGQPVDRKSGSDSDEEGESLAMIFADYMSTISADLQIKESFEKGKNSTFEKRSWIETEKGPLVISQVNGITKEITPEDGVSKPYLAMWEGTDSHFHPGSGITMKISFLDGRPALRRAYFPDNRSNWLFQGLPFHDRVFESEWRDPVAWVKDRLPSTEK